MTSCPMCNRLLSEGSHAGCIERLWSKLELAALAAKGEAINVLQIVKDITDPATPDQLWEIGDLELHFGGVKQMGLPRSLTRAEATAYLKVLTWKRTPYEDRVSTGG